MDRKRVKLKVCGMKYPENIAEVWAIKPDYMGFIFYEASKRYIDALAPELVKGLDGVKKVGVFVNASLEQVQAAVEAYGLDLVQLHGAEDVAFAAAVGAMGVEVMKAFGIGEDFDWQLLAAYEPVVQYFLFDTKTAAHGGSGQTFDWSLLENYRLQKPYFLSGGLSAENVKLALASEDPRLFAIDVNSKFELRPGLKDVTLLKTIYGN